jgi:hypothetical protein
MPSQFELQVVPGMVGLSQSHPAANQSVEEFYADIRTLPGIAIKERDEKEPQPGAKGVLQQVLLTPESASAAWAIVKVIKLWLSRDRRRTLSVTVNQPGRDPLTIEASGDSISVQALERAIHDAAGADANS